MRVEFRQCAARAGSGTFSSEIQIQDGRTRIKQEQVRVDNRRWQEFEMIIFNVQCFRYIVFCDE